MCGIIGIVKKTGIDSFELQCMSRIQRHRGPDDEGYVLIDNQNQQHFLRGDGTINEFSYLPHINKISEISAYIGLAHRRLSIIDLSYAGHQPMGYNENKFIIVYNGEVYNYKEIKRDLQSKDYTFTSNSDTEVILGAYNEWGGECVKKFIGMWAFAILDLKENIVFLSRDRFGIKPLYYTARPEAFAFSSEIKGLLELDFVKRNANYYSIYQYLSFGTLSNYNKTLFEDILELPPGHNLIYKYNEDNLILTQYYDLSYQIKNYIPQINETEPTLMYKTLFEDSINLHLRSDVSVGSCLSGGLDSSAIVAYSIPKINNHFFNTFSAVYNDKNIDESYYAGLVSSHFKNIRAFYTYPTSEKYWQDIDKLTWHQDLPIDSTSMFAQWEVMKLAKSQNMKVLLDGQGSDESLGGYSIFAGIFLLNLLKKGRMFSFVNNAKRLKENRSINIWNEIWRVVYYILPDILKRKVMQKKRIGHSFISPEFEQEIQDLEIPERISKNINIKESCILAIKYGLHELLRYEDRNSMAFSIESRVPFLDHRLVEYTLSLTDNWKISNGWSKYILRKIAEPYLPGEVVWRKDKKGFITPQKAWKKELNQNILNYLRNYDFPKILNKQQIVNFTLTDINDSTQLSEFWRMLSFLKWVEVYKVKI
jgi:asparagine synthase (glutamine-hydrolysing)